VKKPSKRRRRANNLDSSESAHKALTPSTLSEFKDEDDYTSEQGGRSLLGRAKASWCMGDWETLADIEPRDHSRHPDRDRIALLVGSAQQQLGRHDEARECIRLALGWGCNPRVVAQILISGVHNTLARAAALAEDEARVRAHFRAAVLPGAVDSDLPLLSQVRSVREMTRLELFSQAAGVMGNAIAEAKLPSARPIETQVRIRVLESEMDLLKHELSLAQRRNQILQPRAPEATPADVGSAEWIEGLKQRAMSQLGQDLWVLEMSEFKRGGFFVEFGATDGVLLSNTYLLETEFGWNGICAEPNPKLYAQLKKNRRCIVSDACIAGRSGETAEFIFADAFGGMERHAFSDEHAERRKVYAATHGVGKLMTTSLDDFLRNYKAPIDIDYISIDTEGSELEILSSFSFDQWNVRLFSIEHNFTPLREHIFELLQKHGYSRIEREWDDWYFRGDLQCRTHL
jgi:FkbM family methyltransferase